MKSQEPAVERRTAQVQVRWMIHRDMPGVMRIERDSWDEPLTEEDFARSLAQQNCIGMVAELDDQIVGYMLYEMRSSCLGIMNLAVCPYHRHHGIGWQLIDKLKSKLGSHRRTKIKTTVREDLLDAQLFLRACGFTATRVFRGCFGERDGYRMVFAEGH